MRSEPSITAIVLIAVFVGVGLAETTKEGI